MTGKDISFENVDGKLQVKWHVKCSFCDKDITAYRYKLPPLEDGTVDDTSAAFECPLDKNVKIITTSDIYDEVTKWQQGQENG